MYTADAEHASCDCDVSLRLFGSTGSTSELLFKKHQGNFERSVIDTFQCEFEDVGKPNKLRVNILPKSNNARNQWCLEKIELYQQNDKNKIYTFFLNNWIARETNYSHEIPLSKGGGGAVSNYKTTYHVITKTGDMLNANCDSNVFIVLSGRDGFEIF